MITFPRAALRQPCRYNRPGTAIRTNGVHLQVNSWTCCGRVIAPTGNGTFRASRNPLPSTSTLDIAGLRDESVPLAPFGGACVAAGSSPFRHGMSSLRPTR
jgi:hypothetical protein